MSETKVIDSRNLKKRAVIEELNQKIINAESSNNAAELARLNEQKRTFETVIEGDWKVRASILQEQKEIFSGLRSEWAEFLGKGYSGVIESYLGPIEKSLSKMKFAVEEDTNARYSIAMAQVAYSLTGIRQKIDRQKGRQEERAELAAQIEESIKLWSHYVPEKVAKTQLEPALALLKDIEVADKNLLDIASRRTLHFRNRKVEELQNYLKANGELLEAHKERKKESGELYAKYIDVLGAGVTSTGKKQEIAKCEKKLEKAFEHISSMDKHLSEINDTQDKTYTVLLKERGKLIGQVAGLLPHYVALKKGKHQEVDKFMVQLENVPQPLEKLSVLTDTVSSLARMIAITRAIPGLTSDVQKILDDGLRYWESKKETFNPRSAKDIGQVEAWSGFTNEIFDRAMAKEPSLKEKGHAYQVLRKYVSQQVEPQKSELKASAGAEM